MSDLPSEVHRTPHLSPSSEALFNKVYAAPVESEHPAGKFLKAGQVNYMSVPSDWVLRSHGRLPAAASAIDYSPPGRNDVYIGHFYRGHRISDASGQTFHKLLQSPPHVLSDAEHKSLGELFHDQADYRFNASSVRTEDLNGRRVLIIEGEDKVHPYRSKTLFVDTDETGSAPQELSYYAPSEVYDKYADVAEKAFKSILWKK